MSSPLRLFFLPSCMMALVAVIAAVPTLTFAADSASSADGKAMNMIGRQSQNEGMVVVPKPGPVVIDGDLSDWDFSGRIWAFADTAIRNRYSVEAAAMWDQDALYLSAKWKDPTPMYSTVDPSADAGYGWKSDSWQIRMCTADTVVHITTWYYAPKKLSVVQLTYGIDENNAFGSDSILLYGETGSSALTMRTVERGKSPRDYLPQPGDVAMGYRLDSDGKGYAQEIKLSWKLLFRAVPALKNGTTLRIGNEFLWGDPSGKTWPIHRYADNMQPGVTSREFYWSGTKAWGDAVLKDHGNVAVRRYQAEGSKPPGVVPVRLTIPKKAARFTVAIDDAAGKHVRALAGDFDPLEYAVPAADKDNKETMSVEVLWDCLDDFGKPVAPGIYHAVGLSHEGLGTEYEMSFYNPGTPAWSTKNGAGAWGADHSAPLCVAACGECVAVSWAGAEGGSGIIGIGADGQKKWGDKRGAMAMAMDDTYLYAYAGDMWTGKASIARFGRTDGSYKPFILDGKERPFELSIADILAGDAHAALATLTVSALAVHDGVLVLALSPDAGKDTNKDGTNSGGALLVLDIASAKPRQVITTAAATGLTVTRDGHWFAVLGGKVCSIDLATGTPHDLPTPGVGSVRAIAADGDGNIVVLDTGADAQVKAFDHTGKPAYTCGKTGGRALRGPFDAQTMTHMTSVAVDGKNNVWVVENWDYPRRVSVWGRDGKLVRDYIGNTSYAGGGAYLHDHDANRAFWGPVAMSLDKEQRTYRVDSVLWVPDAAKNEFFPIEPGEPNAKFMTSSASGSTHNYVYVPGDKAHVVYMQRGADWQPVAAIGYVMALSGSINWFDGSGAKDVQPSGTFAGMALRDGFIWNDTNKDGRFTLDECTLIKADGNDRDAHGAKPTLRLGGWWGTRCGADLSIYTDGIVRWKPISFSTDGAPVYGIAGKQPMAEDHGEYLPLDDLGILIVSSQTGYGELSYFRGLDLKTGAERWRFPAPYYGVHGSHNAPMPKPGEVPGALKLLGSANLGGEAGTVWAVRSNLGRDYVLTSDGLFVGALFQDARLPTESMPEKEIAGYAMDAMSNGGEPFNGWFGRQDDGKVRLLAAMGNQTSMIVRVNGLDSIHRVDGPKVNIDAEILVKAAHLRLALAAAKAGTKKYVIKKLAAPPAIDGGDKGWDASPAIEIKREGSPDQATARIGYDAHTLFVRFDVHDATPWRNEGKDRTRLFKTGDSVDLQLCADAKSDHTNLGPSHVRLVFAQLNGKPVCVLMKPIDPSASKELQVKMHSPVGDHVFDRVEVRDDILVSAQVHGQDYRVEAAIPLTTIGLAAISGSTIHADLGFISSDATGTINTARTYWSNQATNLVNDLPQEAWLYPGTWGEMTFE